MGKITIAKARQITKPGMYHDSPTLYLNVARGGSKSWVQRIAIEERRHDLGLGGFPLITPEHARRRAAVNRLAVSDGKNPLANKRKAKVPTFQVAAEKTYEALKPRWRSNTTARNWTQSMTKHVYPIIGDMPVNRIGREEILRILTPIWATTPEITRRVRQRIRSTLRWAQAHGFAQLNVAGEDVSGALPGHAKGALAFSCIGLQRGPRGIQDY